MCIVHQELGLRGEELALLLDQVSYKVASLGDVDVASAVGVHPGPDFDVLLNLIVTDPALVGSLHLVETLQSYGNEEIQENQADNDDEYHEDHDSQRIVRLAAPLRLIAILLVLLIIECFLFAIVVDALVLEQVLHGPIPALARHHLYEGQQGVVNLLEVDAMVQRS